MMQKQVRKNILTNKWEVQIKETATSRWEKVAEFDTKEKAENYALAAANHNGNKLHVKTKKTAQNASKPAKKVKNK